MRCHFNLKILYRIKKTNLITQTLIRKLKFLIKIKNRLYLKEQLTKILNQKIKRNNQRDKKTNRMEDRAHLKME